MAKKSTNKTGEDSPKKESLITVMTSSIKKGDFIQQTYGWGKVVEDSYRDANGVYCVKLLTKVVKFMSNDQPIEVKRYK